MGERKIPLTEVLRIVFGIDYPSDAEITLSVGVEMVLKSKIREKKDAIEKLLHRFGAPSLVS